MTRTHTATIALAAIMACCLLPAPAAANTTQESIFMDDSEIVFGDDAKVEATFRILRSLGVDRVRLSVLWHLIAPDPRSRKRPAFGAGGPSDPAAYSPAAWNRYDRIVGAARRNGIGVLFNITVPGPFWASSDPAREESMLDPNPADFQAFVTAVGRRYSGTYVDEKPVQPPVEALPFPFNLLNPPPPAPPQPPDVVLPRVAHWSIMNEPNQPGWLRPQAVTIAGRTVPASPRVYRGLVDGAYRGLVDSGHARDTILLGETAPRGATKLSPTTPMRPLLFIRELYCLDRRLRPFRGEAARIRGCPADAAGSARFSADHPGLFRATAWAHHPYGLEVAPAVKDPVRDQVTLGVLGRLPRALDAIQRRYRSSKRYPIWLTEYGYQTNPPDPIIGVSWARQASYINEADYIAYRIRRVRAVAQFLLIDDGPNRKVAPNDPRYWGSTFQSGLATGEGVRKNAFKAYERPIHVTRRRVRRGMRVRVYGQLRPAAARARLTVALQFRPRGAKRWRVVRRMATRNLRNHVLSPPVRLVRSGQLRLVWSGRRATRAVGVTVLPRRRR